MDDFGLGEAIRTQRQRLGLTQAKLAELAGCSKPSVIAAEKGKPTLRLEILLSLLRVLGLRLTIEGVNQP